MDHPLKSDGLDDMDELKQAFTKRVVPPALEERLLSSKKLRRDLLELATKDEVYFFIRKSQMSSQLRSQLLDESPVTSTNKTTSTPTPTPTTNSDGKDKHLKSSGRPYHTEPSRSTGVSDGSFTTSTPKEITAKHEVPSFLTKDKLPTKDLASATPAKRVFTAKRTLPPHLVSKPNPTPKPSEPAANKPVISASPTSPNPSRVVSDILQTLRENRLPFNASEQTEDIKDSLASTSQRRPSLAVPQIIVHPPSNSHPQDPSISDEQVKDLKRKRDDSSPLGLSRDSHPQKSRKGSHTNTPLKTLGVASSKTQSENELLPANRERTISKGYKKLRLKDVIAPGASALSNDTGGSRLDTINSRKPNTDVVSNTKQNRLASHRRPPIDEDSDETDDDIPLRKKQISSTKATKTKETKTDWDYHIWTFPSGETQPTSGALLPRGYTLHDNPEAPWICPIRSCRVLFSKLEGLGAHFNRGHRATQLNDNGDGTLSIIKKLKAIGVAMPAEVVSHKPLDPEEPLKEPTLNHYLKSSKSTTPSSSQAGDNKDRPTKAHRSGRTLSDPSLLGTETLTREDSLKISSHKKKLVSEVGPEVCLLSCNTR
ncbi:hypothetical protein F5Y00DRAFT_233271 [Daldinia vernicosa]|uniref:uncharacterized protein n=1 Tax=Daldinia vernicosa TaxID=114800 RepID=UPI002008294A|nr:uncharacterized protein F5Y00DRAFT_233271 [Daldinia vernicosa]KAI0850413.1 hypothetical protein F5Y00DRAFT_233271 [Daldinia vernicosa]